MMARQIKFRVWDGKGGKLLGYEFFNTILNAGFFYTNLSELKEGESEEDLICHSEYHNPPMLRPSMMNQLFREQFTGLKDKNGKEIYEGDIMDYPHIAKKKEIVYLSGSFGVLNREELGRSFGSYQIADGFVIGNIHENPELL